MDPSFFERFGFRPTDYDQLDRQLAAEQGLICLYLWGEQCFNCDRFKAQALLTADRFAALPLVWLEANVYADVRLGKRFALHGVPAFFFFKNGRKLGRVTGWPGIGAFAEATEKLNKSVDNP